MLPISVQKIKGTRVNRHFTEQTFINFTKKEIAEPEWLHIYASSVSYLNKLEYMKKIVLIIPTLKK